MTWMNEFTDDRQLKEIRFSRLYRDEFDHGTDGHNAKKIIATMADLLDEQEEEIEELKKEVERWRDSQ